MAGHPIYPQGMTRPDQTALPDDLGNDMSERSGHYDESESGLTDTPTGQGTPNGQPTGAVPTVTGERRGVSSTGTSFGTTGNDDKKV